MWDTEVDIVVIGAGIGGLANAIATVDAGGEVLVVDSRPVLRTDAAPVAVRERVGIKRGLLLPDTLDVETNEYFAALVEGVPVEDSRDATVPRRSARNLSREEVDRRFVEPFIGSRLTGWAAKCISSPYGLLYTSMRDWRTTTMRSTDGESIEVTSIGTVDWADGAGLDALREWVIEQARRRDIDVESGSALQRIVFEEGVIVGVVLSTPEGPLAVRTRAGVTLAPRDGDPASGDLPDASSVERLQVCLVGRTASRFGRVELLTTQPAAVRPTCTGSRRQLREGMHEARQPSLEGWRCGKVHGYPAFGQ
jgi:glycine/D-amino acid oxidase-like deaminating enzyme